MCSSHYLWGCNWSSESLGGFFWVHSHRIALSLFFNCAMCLLGASQSNDWGRNLTETHDTDHCRRVQINFLMDYCIFIFTRGWELIKSVWSHGSLTLLFLMKVMVWGFVGYSYKVMIILHSCCISFGFAGSLDLTDLLPSTCHCGGFSAISLIYLLCTISSGGVTWVAVWG